MPQLAESYYADRARQSQIAMAEASDPGARLAHAQLKAAYEGLARYEQAVLHLPNFRSAPISAIDHRQPSLYPITEPKSEEELAPMGK